MEFSIVFSPYLWEDMFQWMSGTVDSMEPYIYCFSYTYRLMIKFNL